MALIVTTEINGVETEIGVARYVTNPDGESCEFAIVIADEWHTKGIGSHLLENLVQIARMKGFKMMDGEVLVNNKAMTELLRTFGFTLTSVKEDPSIYYIKKTL